MVEDYGKKDYAFALYKEEWKLITSKDYMYNPAYVVVNARNRNNKILGIVKELKSTEEYGKNVTAQVGGVVNMDAYNARWKDEQHHSLWKSGKWTSRKPKINWIGQCTERVRRIIR